MNPENYHEYMRKMLRTYMNLGYKVNIEITQYDESINVNLDKHEVWFYVKNLDSLIGDKDEDESEAIL